MKTKRFNPLFDKLFVFIFIPTAILMIVITILACFEPIVLFIMIPADLLTFYFIFTPLFGYVELRENSLFIKFGLILKREIPYSKIRCVIKERSFISESMLSLKNAFEHVKIKYNTYDVIIISVIGNDEFIKELESHRLTK